MKSISKLCVILFMLFPSFVFSQESNLGLSSTMNTYNYLCQENNLSPVYTMEAICKVVIASEVCKEVPKKDLLRCDDINNKSQFDAFDFIKGCVTGVFDSVKDLLAMIWDLMQWTWKNATSAEAFSKTVQQADEYLSATKLYLNTEYQKALARSNPPLKELKAVKAMSGAIASLILNKVTEAAGESYRELGCMNFEAKSKFVCKLMGDIFIPPAAVFGLVKYGPKAIDNFPNLKKLFKPEPDANSAKVTPKSTPISETAKFKELIEKYPKLQVTFEKIGKNIPAGNKIDHIREIPYEKSIGFRALSTAEMLKRAEKLDPETSKLIVTAYNSLNDKAELKVYFQELFIETADRLAKSGKAKDVALLKEGLISNHDIAVTVTKRLKERGDNQFLTIQRKLSKPLSSGKIKLEGEDLSTDNGRFRTAIKTGPFFDNAFSPKSASRATHGPYSHLIQRDIIYKNLMEVSKGNPQKLWDFLGSKKGVHYWVDLFDAGERKSFNRPEELMKYLNHTLTGLDN